MHCAWLAAVEVLSMAAVRTKGTSVPPLVVVVTSAVSVVEPACSVLPAASSHSEGTAPSNPYISNQSSIKVIEVL